jgi:hypothetical protein
MTIENATGRMIESFNCGTFPEPHEFTDQQIEAIAAMPGIDPYGTFADSPLEQSLMRRYDLEESRGENTWPALAEMLREEKSGYFARIPSIWRDLAWNQLNEAIAACLSLGISRDEMSELFTSV